MDQNKNEPTLMAAKERESNSGENEQVLYLEVR